MKHLRGFTLIELMVTIAVLIVLLAMGVPALQQYATKNRAVAQVNRISGDMSLARSEAIKRGVAATLCGSTDSTEATPSCDTSNWEEGWIAFADLNADGDFNGSDVLLSAADPLPGGLTLRAIKFDATDKVRIQSNGAIRDADDDGDADGSFVVCDSEGTLSKARALNVSNLGRSSIATDTDSDDIVNDVDDDNVTCP